MLKSDTSRDLHCIVHQHQNGVFVVSVDLLQHMDELSAIVTTPASAQSEVELDEFSLLKKPRPGPPKRTTQCSAFADTSPRPSRKVHSSESDKVLFDLVHAKGCRWREIARDMGGLESGFTDDVVRNRYIRCLRAAGLPYLANTPRCKPRRPTSRVSRWSKEDDEVIWSAMLRVGCQWQVIARSLPHRTYQAVRNRASRTGMCARLSQRDASAFRQNKHSTDDVGSDWEE